LRTAGILPLHHFFFDSAYGWSIAASQASAASMAWLPAAVCKENVLPSSHINQAGAFHLVQVCQQYLVKTLTFA